jgi:hypothetical protein
MRPLRELYTSQDPERAVMQGDFQSRSFGRSIPLGEEEATGGRCAGPPYGGRGLSHRQADCVEQLDVRQVGHVP